ncbi:MAG: HEAT repeat domain-containing protein [Deltaproteobacteria bacterium]|nr:HEAT repeat domain-containing protein [Deltaproteobacteria bacterium]
MHSSPYQRRTYFYPAPAILAGLLTAQIIATLQVYVSNRSIYLTLKAIGEAGYLTVLNQQTIAQLQKLSTALCGGLFFTLSVGAGISLLSFAAAWLWDRICVRRPIFLILMLLLWTALVAAVNIRGFLPFVTLYFVIIPPVVFPGTLQWMPKNVRKKTHQNGILHIILLILLGLLWAPQMKDGLFINIRDQLLLTNPIGENIVRFYYRRTLYPAKVMKPLHQKLMKTFSLEALPEGHIKNALLEGLLARDWIPIENRGKVDLKVSLRGKELFLEDGKGTVLKVSATDFPTRLTTVLKEYSNLTDRHHFFRRFTFYSLLIGFPVILYISFYSLISFFVGRWVPRRIASLLCAIVCLITGVMLLMLLRQNHEWKGRQNDPGRALISDERQERLGALKHIYKDHQNISRFSAYKAVLTSPDTAERYWLAKALGSSRNDETYPDLLALLKDPSPVVVCAAISSLGHRGEKKAVPNILKQLRESQHPYVQWYAYKALKALGWKQKARKMRFFSH